MAANPGSPDHKSPPAGANIAHMRYASDPEADAAATFAASAPQAMRQGVDLPPVCATCKIPLHLSFFFDGTGNNRDADESSHQDSNVARLFRSHPLDNAEQGVFSFYLPGLGTYFPDIGDPGETNTGKAFGAYGKERLTWAMQQLDLTLAKYPAKNIQEIRVALFGFSRGAASARAFARLLADRAKPATGGWQWDKPAVPFRLIFIGVFDTVASVGLPATASTGLSLQIAKGWSSLERGLRIRGESVNMGATSLAFGEPGADPTPGNPDGHMDWASNLRIPELAERCIHMVAAHEQRNSFPMDSVRERQAYPSNCVEILYPGMHSDLGGGYLPGFQARGISRQEILSNIPLLAMHKEAINAKVPLEAVGQFHDSALEIDFQVSRDMVKRWQHYMSTVGNGGRAVGKGVLAHMRLYFAWRFQRIAAYSHSEVPKTERLPGESDMRTRERDYAARKAAAEREMNQAENSPERKAAQQAARDADRNYRSAQTRAQRLGDPNGDLARAKQAQQAARARLQAADDPYLRAKAKWAGIPGNSVDNMLVYDKQLMRDVALLRQWTASPLGRNRKVRPHYAGLTQAYEDEFVHGRGLRDREIIAFFDQYVHDSLAGFGMDASLPSDPRCIYVGGDYEARYAQIDTQETVDSQAA